MCRPKILGRYLIMLLDVRSYSRASVMQVAADVKGVKGFGTNEERAIEEL